jgi:hypothetical protein
MVMKNLLTCWVLSMFGAVALANSNIETWRESATVYQTKHWTLRTDLPRTQAIDAGKLFDAVYEAYRIGLAMLPEKSNEKLEAWVFNSRTDYINTLSTITTQPENSAGMFIPSLGITAVDVSGSWSLFESTAKHEAFHQFANSRFPDGLPAWLNEGLAEYFENTTYINGAIINGQVQYSRLQLLQRDIQSGGCIRFLELMRMSLKTWNQNLAGENGSKQYRQSWAMVHFLIHANNGQFASQFDDFLLLISKGENHEKAFVKAFKTNDLENFERVWSSYILDLKPSSALIAAHRLNFLASGFSELYRRQMTVSSLQGLQSSLKSINYQTTLNVNYRSEQFDARNQHNYYIPPDSLSPNPRFVVQAGNPHPAIYTSGLEPFDMSIKWNWNNGQLGWSIVVGN